MRLDYSIDASDVIALSQAQIGRTPVPTSVKNLRRMNWFLAVAFAVLAYGSLYLLRYGGLAIGLTLAFLAFSSGFAMQTPLGWRFVLWRARREVSRHLHEDLLSPFPTRMARIDRRHLIHFAGGIEYRIPWRLVDGITATPEGLFISVNKELFLTIPRHSVRHGDYDSFLAQAGARITDAAYNSMEPTRPAAAKRIQDTI